MLCVDPGVTEENIRGAPFRDTLQEELTGVLGMWVGEVGEEGWRTCLRLD